MPRPASGTLRVQGITALVRDLKRLGLEVDDLKDAFSKIAADGAARVARYAPKRSGRLAADSRGNRAQSKAVITSGRATVPYAGPINYGWAARGIEAANYMQRADQDIAPVALTQLETEINTAIRNLGLA